MADPISGISGGFDIPVGSEITDQVLGYMQIVGNMKLQSASMMLSHDANMAQIGAQLQASANALQGQLAGVAASQRAADQQYDVDLRQLGLQAADLNYRQRTSQVQAQIATIDSGVNYMKAQTETAMANFQQRVAVADRKIGIADMLARRSGPQDLVAYNSLLNFLDPQEPGGGSMDVDPFSWLDELDQPIEFELPEWAQGISPDPNSIYQEASVGGGAPIGAGYTGGGGEGGAGGTPYQYTPSAGAQTALDYLQKNLEPAPSTGNGVGMTGFPIADVPGGGQWSLITMGPGGDVDRSAFDPSITKVYGQDQYGPDGVPEGTPQVTTAKAGQPYWVYRMAAGGRASPREMQQGEDGAYRIGPVQVGDNPEGTPSGNEEVAMVTTSDPNAQLTVQPTNARGIAAQAGAEDQGSVPGGDPLSIIVAAVTEAMSALSAIQNLIGGMGGEGAMPMEPGAGLEGVVGMPGGGGGPPPGMMPPPGAMPGGPPMPMPRAAAGTQMGPTLGGRVPGQSPPWAPPMRAQPMPGPRPGMGMQGPFGGGMRDQLMRMLPPQFQQAIGRYGSMNPRQMMAGYGGMNLPIGAAGGPQPGAQGVPGIDPIAANWAPPGQEQRSSYPDPYGAAGVTRSASGRSPQELEELYRQRVASGVPIPGLAMGGSMGAYPLRAATGGSFDPSAQAQESFGGANTKPIISIRRYTPEQIAGLPAVQNLIGGRRSAAFGAPTVPIGNPDVGLSNVSPFVNLQRYGKLDPTGQDLIYSLFQQGLEQDMRDVMRRSQAAAPGAAQWQQGMSRVA